MTKNILTEQAKHPLHKCLYALKWGRPAAAQKYLVNLANEHKRKNPRPVCPECGEPMVRIRFADEIRSAWVCPPEPLTPNAQGQRPSGARFAEPPGSTLRKEK